MSGSTLYDTVLLLSIVAAIVAGGWLLWTAKARTEQSSMSPQYASSSDIRPRKNSDCKIDLASGYLSGCVVEHHWECNTCEFSWTSRFHPLLI
jgi:hypothetical protein